MESNLLNENSYSPIVREIFEQFKNIECSTLVGNQLCSDTYNKLSESSTPIIELKQFTTDAEILAKDDIKLKELVDFCAKKVTGGDLNFIINLCKEEHFKEMSRLNHPKPEATIKEIEHEFNQPASVIEEGIKAGLFDTLKSDLLGTIKKDLKIQSKQTKDLNESGVIIGTNIVKYSPVGVKLEDPENNRMLLLTESTVLAFSRETDLLTPLTESEIKGLNIPAEHKRLLDALNSTPYSPEAEEFNLFEKWDFNLTLKGDGELKINGKDLKKEDLKSLLLESVQTYVAAPGQIENFNKMNFLRDADRFIMLTENTDNLVKLDTITVLKNLSENSFVMFDNKNTMLNSEPKIIASSNKEAVKLFESYGEFVGETNRTLGSDLTKLFEAQLINEKGLIDHRNEQIVNLSESQREININIEKVDNLISLSESGSPAEKKLADQKNQLNVALDKNLESLNFYKNDFKLY